MEQTEIITFIALANAILIIFTIGIFLFIIQYRKRKIEHENEKIVINHIHTQEIQTTQLEMQQQTMQFIGREIHDNVGQKLTLASLYAKHLSQSINGNADKINTVGNIIDEALNDLRQLSKSLTNPSLVTASLKELLLEEAARINALGSCYVDVQQHSESISMTPAQKNIAFRILQEFMQNSLKHAGCRRITITLDNDDAHFTVAARDDGNGFDLLKKSNGQGLANMQRRAQEIGATYTFESTPGNGTTMNISLPLNVN